MPFTPAHAAIVLPLVKINPRYISATGLIIGSVSPDFEYFIKMSVDSQYSHTFPGLFYFNVPVTILLALAFHLAIKRNLIENLPHFLQKRFQQLLRFDFVAYLKNHTLAFILSACAGAGTHLLWDGFTHYDGFFAQRIPALRTSFIPYLGVRYPAYYALQHISTAVGLIILLIYIIFMRPDKEAITRRPSIYYWLGITVVTGLILLIRFSIVPADRTIGNLVVTAIAGICVGLIVLGLIKIKRNTDQRFG